MPRRSHLNAVSRRPVLFVETSAPAEILDEQSGVRALPQASLPPPHPVALAGTGIRRMHAPADQARPSIVPELRLVSSEPQQPLEVSQRLLLERAQRKARIKQAAAEASVRLARLFAEQEEAYREEMVWRAKLREAKQGLQEETQRKASLIVAQARLARAREEERARREEAEWQAVILAARCRKEDALASP